MLRNFSCLFMPIYDNIRLLSRFKPIFLETVSMLLFKSPFFIIKNSISRIFSCLGISKKNNIHIFSRQNRLFMTGQIPYLGRMRCHKKCGQISFAILSFSKYKQTDKQYMY